MRRKPMTLAVAVLVFMSSALAFAGPAQILSRMLAPIKGSAGRTQITTESGQSLDVRLPQAGQVENEIASQVIVEPAATAARERAASPIPTARQSVVPTATPSPLPMIIDIGEIKGAVTATAAAPATATLAAPAPTAVPAATASAPTAAPSPAPALPPTATTAPTQAPPPPTSTAAPTSAPAPTAAPQREAGVPDRIVVQDIGLDSKIIPIGWRVIVNADGSKSAEWNVAEYAVSWHKTSARLGEVGNTVLTGHNNIVGEVFRHLDALKAGDPVTIYSGEQAFQYKVADRFIVQEVGVPYEQRLENAKWIGKFSDERVTLMSCYPYTGDTHRIFIVLKPAG